MRRFGVLASLTAACCAMLPLAALAQQAPPTAAPPPASSETQPNEAQAPVATPRGPAQVISGAQAARRERELKQAAAAAEAPAARPGAPEAPDAPGSGAPPETQTGQVQADPATDPHAGIARNPHAGMAGQGSRPLTRGQIDPSLPAGSVRVLVIDERDAPIANAEVVLGVMRSDGSRGEHKATTSADGRAMFSELPAGDQQAYRANVPHQGARFSSNPFRLPLQSGYDVMVRRLPVTRDDTDVVLYVGATSVELKDERLKIVQQARLYNIGAQAYAFPDGGLLVPLPAGFIAVQSEEKMTDQRIVEAPGEGVRIHGSLLPGETTLLWGFDLPQSGTEARLSLEIPWKTFAYRVIAEAAEGLSIRVEGFPDPVLHDDEGRRFFVTELQRRVGDPPFEALQIHVKGIPGPGPGRWIAVLLSVFAIAIGAAAARKPSAQTVEAESLEGLQASKASLLARAAELRAQREAGEIGPEYHAQREAELAEALSLVLLQEARRGRAT